MEENVSRKGNAGFTSSFPYFVRCKNEWGNTSPHADVCNKINPSQSAPSFFHHCGTFTAATFPLRDKETQNTKQCYHDCSKGDLRQPMGLEQKRVLQCRLFQFIKPTTDPTKKKPLTVSITPRHSPHSANSLVENARASKQASRQAGKRASGQAGKQASGESESPSRLGEVACPHVALEPELLLAHFVMAQGGHPLGHLPVPHARVCKTAPPTMPRQHAVSALFTAVPRHLPCSPAVANMCGYSLAATWHPSPSHPSSPPPSHGLQHAAYGLQLTLSTGE